MRVVLALVTMLGLPGTGAADAAEVIDRYAACQSGGGDCLALLRAACDSEGPSCRAGLAEEIEHRIALELEALAQTDPALWADAARIQRGIGAAFARSCARAVARTEADMQLDRAARCALSAADVRYRRLAEAAAQP
ncbi:hypothetical protein HMH01_13515 [Halovulum dunhuangense]|uniref:Lysozyme inhibitor LprI N-terminal domain-containing protein n=1 Tax=Halovulum dunhuangense TaxID=1505036 RepID=A0A849L507_9RHOB|nr:hypothetical protein [Halovulum dunhuangense]NNU81455.1 hypothetical protein [Halovulum dunhuangense]